MQTGMCPTFANYGDLVAFADAVERGCDFYEALNYGDNGRGAFGVVTAQEHTPMVALSPEDGEGHKGGDLVKVTFRGITIEAQWQDKRPAKANVTPGTVIEANPALCVAFGVPDDSTFGPVSWEWA